MFQSSIPREYDPESINTQWKYVALDKLRRRAGMYYAVIETGNHYTQLQDNNIWADCIVTRAEYMQLSLIRIQGDVDL